MFKWYFDWKRSKAQRPKVSVGVDPAFKGSDKTVYTFYINGKSVMPGDPEWEDMKKTFDQSMVDMSKSMDAGMKALDEAMESLDRTLKKL